MSEPRLGVTVVPVTPFRQNCSVAWAETSGRPGAVIDPGGDFARIERAVAEAGVTVTQVLVTHGHVDHASAVRATADHYGVPIVGPHVDDAFLLAELDAQGRRYGIPGARAFEPDRWLDAGDEVAVGPLRFEVLHCPGHTPGHVVFYVPAARYAFVGDVLFRGSVGRSDLPRGSFEALVASIRGTLFPLGDDVTFLPGHGDPSTFGWERRCNPFVCDLAVGD